MKQNLFFTATAALCIIVLVSTGISYGQENVEGTKAESIEDWETGDFSLFEWQFGGNADWTITDAGDGNTDSGSRITWLYYHLVLAAPGTTYTYTLTAPGNAETGQIILEKPQRRAGEEG